MPFDPLKPVIRCCVAALCLWTATCGQTDGRPENTVIYINDDSDSGRRLMAALDAALDRELSGRYRVRLRYLVVDLRDPERMQASILEAVQTQPAAIVATNSETAAIAKSLTRDIPIIFGSRQDPIRLGLVHSLARPGGNITGFTYFVPIDQKRLELLREVAPRARELGVLVDRWWIDESDGGSVLEVARSQGFDPHIFLAETPSDLAQALRTPRAQRIDAWYVPYTVLPFDNAAAVVNMLESLRKPVAYPATQFVELGGLISYQQSLPLEESSRLIAKMVVLVLEGVRPAEIPIERPKSFALAINLTKAKKLGIAVAPALIKRADQIVVRDDAH